MATQGHVGHDAARGLQDQPGGFLVFGLAKIVPMKIIDATLWQAQKAEIALAPESQYGQAFLEFCEAWCDAAEAWLEPGWTNDEVRKKYAIDALRATFEPTQQAMFSILSGWLGQLLLVICSNWAYGGDELFNSMNPLEQRFVGDAALAIHNEASLRAETVPDAPPS